jgi:hypothetical protein
MSPRLSLLSEEYLHIGPTSNHTATSTVFESTPPPQVLREHPFFPVSVQLGPQVRA